MSSITRLLTVASLTLLAMSGFAPRAAAFVPVVNLVDNPGFETGDFSDYTQQTAASGSDLEIGDNHPNTGSFEAEFGGTDPADFDSISQAITTTPALTYNVSFYLSQGAFGGGGEGGDSLLPPGGLRPAAVAGQEFKVTFGDTVLLDTTDPTDFDFTQMVFPATAVTGTSTTLTFSGYDVEAFYYLDDISVTAVPEPSTWAGFAAGFGALGVVAYRRRRLA